MPSGGSVNASPPDLRRAIGFWGGTAIIVGTVIGSGIFRTPAEIASVLKDPSLTLGLWAAVGVLCLCGCLTLAELGTLLPRTGGTYVYLRSACGDSAAFVFGWIYLVAATPSGMGTLGVVLGEGMTELLYTDPKEAPKVLKLGIGIGCIIILCAANVVGVRWGATIQKLFTAIKVAALLGLIGAALLFGAGVEVSAADKPAMEISAFEGVAAALVSVLFAYNGWVYIGLVCGEVESPDRRLLRIVVVGMLVITAIYIGANAVYYAVLPVDAIAGEKFVAIRIMELIGGSAWGKVMTVCILASVFGAMNGVILTKTRVPYAMSRDGLSFGFLGACHPRWSTPHVAILVQGSIAIVLIYWLQEFGSISAYFVVVEWSALIFGIAAVFVLRRKMADAPRPVRTPGYPVVPLVFVVGTTVGLILILWSKIALKEDFLDRFAPLIGLGISLLGFPVYWIWKLLRQRKVDLGNPEG